MSLMPQQGQAVARRDAAGVVEGAEQSVLPYAYPFEGAAAEQSVMPYIYPFEGAAEQSLYWDAYPFEP